MNDLNKLISCLKELGFKPHINNFEDRLVIQKIGYLLQLKGVNIGFKYGFYIRGPYSRQLTQRVYQNKNQIEELKTGKELTKDEKNKTNELKEKIGLKPGILEIAATYAYFREEGLDPVSILKKVKVHKSFYSSGQIAVGMSRAIEYLFPPTEKDIEEMKKEWRLWELASIEDGMKHEKG